MVNESISIFRGKGNTVVLDVANYFIMSIKWNIIYLEQLAHNIVSTGTMYLTLKLFSYKFVHFRKKSTMSYSRRSRNADNSSSSEFFLECKAAFLSMYDEIDDKIESKKRLNAGKSLLQWFKK